MKELKENRCLVCGKEVNQRERGRRRKYCGRKCSNIYHNHKYTQRQKLPSGLTKCVQCGKEFERDNASTRTCCSSICEHAWGRRNEVEEIRRLALEEKRQDNPRKVRDWALDLHYNGHGRMAITEALGLPKRTLKTWIEKYERHPDGNWHRRPRQKTKPSQEQQHYSYSWVATPDEWLSALREGARNTKYCSVDSTMENRQIFLVCGVTDIRKGADVLGSIIQARLRMNPFEGGVFAFCGRVRDQIRYVYWDGCGFNMVSRKREMGTYAWPPAKLGTHISVTPEDFELVLRSERDLLKCANRPTSWDYLDIPDVPDADFCTS